MALIVAGTRLLPRTALVTCSEDAGRDQQNTFAALVHISSLHLRFLFAQKMLTEERQIGLKPVQNTLAIQPSDYRTADWQPAQKSLRFRRSANALGETTFVAAPCRGLSFVGSNRPRPKLDSGNATVFLQKPNRLRFLAPVLTSRIMLNGFR